MKIEEILEIEEYFTKYSESDYSSPMTCGSSFKVRGRYNHIEEDNFGIVIFEDNEVYQTNSDHECQGIELKTIDELKIRFESFTGENIDKL